MKKFSSLILMLLLTFGIFSTSLPQDYPATGNNTSNTNIFNIQNQNFDGQNFPSTFALATVVPGNGSTSGNGRAPQGSRRFINTKYIITSAEITASGLVGAVTSVGWRWNVPSPPAATAPTSQSATSTGNLRVYLKDTLGSAVTIAGTRIDTNGAGFTKVIDGTITIPTGLAEINIDVPVGGPGTSVYTPTPGSAVILIFVYRTTTAILPTPTGSPNVFCNNLGGNLLTYQSQTVGGDLGAASTFRPETRFGFNQLPDDVGISATNLLNGRIFSVGKSYDFTATVKNFGSNPQTIVPVSYTVDGGSPIGPVNTVGPIPSNGTENVTFSGGNALTGLAAGPHVIKIYSALAGDGNTGNDTLTININVLNKVTTYPLVETFTNPVDWTVLIENAVGGTALWGLDTARNPDGLAGNTIAKANFFSASIGRREVLRSPELDLTGLTNPIVNFYVAYRTFATEQDSLEVVVSTDGGLTFFSASTIYNKADLSVPSLATLTALTTLYRPTDQIQYRHETISLANVAGNTNVVIGFRAKSRFGNNLWLDNVIVSDADGLCTDNVIAPGPYNCNSAVTVDFLTVGLVAPVLVNNDNISINKSLSENSFVGNFVSTEGSLVVNSGIQTDNPTGGTLQVAQYDNDASVQGAGIAPNTTATAPDGTIFTPDVVYQDFWFNLTYTGNDKLGYANYEIDIDFTPLVFNNSDKVYIVKRTDRTGQWVALNTTRTGNILTAAGLNDFSDFAIAGDSVNNPLPVELTSFTSIINRRDVTLNWTTAKETNNSGFDIERNSNGTWSKVGNVTGNGTSSTPNSYSFSDRGLASGSYSYRLKQIDFNGNFEYFNLSNEVNIGIPSKFELSQNYPNPFNPSTTINYDLPFDSKVSIKLFDMSGKEVATLVNETRVAGYYTVNFNASNLSSGVYFYRISAEGSGNNFTATKKMMLLK